MRLFYCVELPSTVRAALAQRARALQGRIRGGKWVAEENLHITVRFLGEVGEDLLPALCDLGSAAAGEVTQFELVLDRLGAFPSPRRARVVWAGPTLDSGPFALLAHRIEEGVGRLGLPAEGKPAYPHVTLGRLRVPQDLASLLGGAPPVSARADSLTLMRSELRPRGPLYTAVGRWPLGG